MLFIDTLLVLIRIFTDYDQVLVNEPNDIF